VTDEDPEDPLNVARPPLVVRIRRDGDFQLTLKANLPLTYTLGAYELRSDTDFTPIPLDGDPWRIVAHLANLARPPRGVSTIEVGGQELTVYYLDRTKTDEQVGLLRAAVAAAGYNVSE